MRSLRAQQCHTYDLCSCGREKQKKSIRCRPCVIENKDPLSHRKASYRWAKRNRRYDACKCGKRKNVDSKHCVRCAAIFSGESRRRPRCERFWAMVPNQPSSGCWEWSGCTNLGYGHFGWNPGVVLAHRASWILTYGEIPRGYGKFNTLHVLHKCDNKKCVRPGHLFLGTAQDNIRDLFDKGLGVRGEVCKNTKLVDADIRKIRQSYAVGGVSYRDLSERFGISRDQIGNIVNRRSWAHVE